MPASLLKPFVSSLRKYFLVVLFVLYTSDKTYIRWNKFTNISYYILVLKQASSHFFSSPYYLLYNKQVSRSNKLYL